MDSDQSHPENHIVVWNRAEMDVEFVKRGQEPWPLAGSWEVFVRIREREVRVGSLIIPQIRGSLFTSAGRIAREAAMTFNEDEVADIILRPDARAAERSADVREYWDGEFTFKNVPLISVER
jgi:hypothetical protein